MKTHHLAVLAVACLAAGVSLGAPVPADETAAVAASEFSAQSRQRPRIRVYGAPPPAFDYPRPGKYSWPGPGAVRQCVDWYATEYRPSGTVVTPQMRCRWVRG